MAVEKYVAVSGHKVAVNIDILQATADRKPVLPDSGVHRYFAQI
jgi:hypothetical protein